MCSESELLRSSTFTIDCLVSCTFLFCQILGRGHPIELQLIVLVAKIALVVHDINSLAVLQSLGIAIEEARLPFDRSASVKRRQRSVKFHNILLVYSSQLLQFLPEGPQKVDKTVMKEEDIIIIIDSGFGLGSNGTGPEKLVPHRL